jgi:hypothetical protein
MDIIPIVGRIGFAGIALGVAYVFIRVIVDMIRFARPSGTGRAKSTAGGMGFTDTYATPHEMPSSDTAMEIADTSSDSGGGGDFSGGGGDYGGGGSGGSWS